MDPKLLRVCSAAEVDGRTQRSEVWTVACSPAGDVYVSTERSAYFRVSLHVSGQFHLRVSPDARRKTLLGDTRFTPTRYALELQRAVQLRIPVATIRHSTQPPDGTTVLVREVEHDMRMLVDVWLAPSQGAEALPLDKAFGLHIGTLALDGPRRVVVIAYYREAGSQMPLSPDTRAEIRDAIDTYGDALGGLVSGPNPDQSIWLSHVRIGRIEDAPEPPSA